MYKQALILAVTILASSSAWGLYDPTRPYDPSNQEQSIQIDIDYDALIPEQLIEYPNNSETLFKSDLFDLKNKQNEMEKK